MGFLDTMIFGYRTIRDAVDAEYTQRSKLKFVGATVADDSVNGVTTVTVTPGSGVSAGAQYQVQTSDGAAGFVAPANVFAKASQLIVGALASVAATGRIVFPYVASETLIGRKDSGAVDRSVIRASGGDELTFGDVNHHTATEGDIVSWRTNGGSTTPLQASDTVIKHGLPSLGDTAQTSPYGGDGYVEVDDANADHVLTATEYSHKMIRLVPSTPATNAIRVITLPGVASDDAAYCKHVSNATGTGYDIHIASSGGGSTVAIADAAGAWVRISTAGAVAL
jgi:hypothetical protein